MAQVLFFAVTAAKYAELETKNPNALYFITDANRIYKGEVPYTHPVATVADFPATGEVGTLYVNSTTLEARVWDGETWGVVSLPVITEIGAAPTDNQLASALAVKTYVDDGLAAVTAGIVPALEWQTL